MNLPEKLSKGVVVGDGALGTALIDKGVFVNTCFEEANCSLPDKVKDIHNEYIKAGCDFIETNTYGANRIMLAPFALSERIEQINVKGVELARQCAKSAEGDCLVAGSVGPIFGCDDADEIFEAYREQISILDKAGVDFFIFETFPDVEILEIALSAAKKITNKEIIALHRPSADWRDDDASLVCMVLERISKIDNVFALGLNCSLGPMDMFRLMSRVIEKSGKFIKPLCVMPNVGTPETHLGRTIYNNTPEYFTEYAKRLYHIGVRIIGGCCGTKSAHIEEAAKAVRFIDGTSRAGMAAATLVLEQGEDYSAKVKLEDRSALGRKLANGEFIKSIEITPPVTINVDSIVEKAVECMRRGVDVVNIPDSPRAKFSQSALATSIKLKQAGAEPLLHFCSKDRNLLAIQADMKAASLFEVNDLLIITGDAPKSGDTGLKITAVSDTDSIGMVKFAGLLNSGHDFAGKPMKDYTKFTIGVGVNPGAVNIDEELERLHKKIEAGADYCVTQPIFDPVQFHQFFDMVGELNIPVLAGIWPFASLKNAEFMANQVDGVVVPQSLLERMRKTTTREEGRREGFEIAIEMIDAIIERVNGLVVSAPFSNIDIALSVLEGID
jgi:homocysteine S-methyltransferase